MRTTFLAVLASAAGVAQAGWLDDMIPNFVGYNQGLMKAMMKNPEEETGTCFTAMESADESIETFFTTSSYKTDQGFEVGNLLNNFQIMSIQILAEMEACGFNEYILQLDNVFSTWSSLGGSFGSLGTQALVGLKNKDTSMYLAWDLMTAENLTAENFAQGLQLLTSQMMKVEAPSWDLPANPINT